MVIIISGSQDQHGCLKLAPADLVQVHGLVEIHVCLSLQPVGADGVDKQAGLLAVGPLPFPAGRPPSSVKTSRLSPPS